MGLGLRINVVGCVGTEVVSATCRGAMLTVGNIAVELVDCE